MGFPPPLPSGEDGGIAATPAGISCVIPLPLPEAEAVCEDVPDGADLSPLDVPALGVCIDSGAAGAGPGDALAVFGACEGSAGVLETEAGACFPSGPLAGSGWTDVPACTEAPPLDDGGSLFTGCEAGAPAWEWGVGCPAEVPGVVGWAVFSSWFILYLLIFSFLIAFI